MGRVLKPIGHDERLSIVDHLDELRSRLIVSVAALLVAFGLCLWQQHRLLDVLNRPLPPSATNSKANPPLHSLPSAAITLIQILSLSETLSAPPRSMPKWPCDYPRSLHPRLPLQMALPYAILVAVESPC